MADTSGKNRRRLRIAAAVVVAWAVLAYLIAPQA
jgi:hypothetical protein